MRIFRILLAGWLIGAVIIVVLSYLSEDSALMVVAATPAGRSSNPAVAVSSEVRRGPAPAPVVRSSGGGSILIPVAGVTSEDLRDTYHEARGSGRKHHAIDILAPRGTPVVAAVDGTIQKLFTSVAGGLTIYQFDVPEERVYYYAHLDRYASGITEGQFVGRGTVIGYVGTTGNAAPDTPHLHFSVEVLPPSREWWSGTPVDPMPLFRTPVSTLP